MSESTVKIKTPEERDECFDKLNGEPAHVRPERSDSLDFTVRFKGD